MGYPKLCKGCNKPFIAKNKISKFCCPNCYKDFVAAKKPKQKYGDKYKQALLEKSLREEWEERETSPTKCYMCGEIMDYWTFEYAMKFGRKCKKCCGKKLDHKV